MVAGHPKTSGTLVVSEVFSLPISQIVCMQPNPLSTREPAMEVELSWRDLLYFEGTRRTKAFYNLRDTISYSEVVAGLAGTSDLRDYLNRITRFGTEWAKDRELRTQYLIDQFRADPSSLVDSPMIVDILSNGTIVLQDGHHRASLLSLAGHDRLLCRLRA